LACLLFAINDCNFSFPDGKDIVMLRITAAFFSYSNRTVNGQAISDGRYFLPFLKLRDMVYASHFFRKTFFRELVFNAAHIYLLFC
jgi:hypothetical protein